MLLVAEHEVEVLIVLVRRVRDGQLAGERRHQRRLGVAVRAQLQAIGVERELRADRRARRRRTVALAEARRVLGPPDEPPGLLLVTARARDRLAAVHDDVALVQRVIEADRRRARTIGLRRGSERDQDRDRAPHQHHPHQ